MIGVLIATHGKMAEGILDSAELIIGKQDNCKVLALHHGDNIELFGESIKNAIIELDKGDGVLVFTDLFAASPYNQTAVNYKKLKKCKYRSITGVNLPMLIEALSERMLGKELDEITASVMKAGKEGIKELFYELKKIKNGGDRNGGNCISTY